MDTKILDTKLLDTKLLDSKKALLDDIYTLYNDGLTDVQMANQLKVPVTNVRLLRLLLGFRRFRTINILEEWKKVGTGTQVAFSFWAIKRRMGFSDLENVSFKAINIDTKKNQVTLQFKRER